MQNTGCIWLIGGTGDSAMLSTLLDAVAIPYLVSVTTEAAIALYPQTPRAQIWVGRLTPLQIPSFLQAHQITAIVDASHPFAVEISRHAIAAAHQAAIPYLRYERAALAPSPPSEPTPLAQPDRVSTAAMPLLPEFRDVAALLASGILNGHRVLLTLGYRFLAQFAPWQSKATLFARILPSPVALEAAIAAGFTPDRLIAFRPPLSVHLEQALWQHWQISLVVTKASGRSGGEDIKRQVAQTLGIPLATIARPPLTYPQQTSDMAHAIAFCQAQCQSSGVSSP